MELEKLTIEKLDTIARKTLTFRKHVNVLKGEGESVQHALSALLLLPSAPASVRPCAGTKIQGRVRTKDELLIVSAVFDGTMYQYTVRNAMGEDRSQVYFDLMNPRPVDHALDVYDPRKGVRYAKRFAYYRSQNRDFACGFRCQERFVMDNSCFQRGVRKFLQKYQEPLKIQEGVVIVAGDQNELVLVGSAGEEAESLLDFQSFLETKRCWTAFLEERDFHFEEKPLLVLTNENGLKKNLDFVLKRVKDCHQQVFVAT